MKIVLSPAKSLNFETELPTTKFTTNAFLKEAELINGLLKKQSPAQLSKLMKISDKLAQLNWKRNQNWKLPCTPKNARPAVFTFNGTVYDGLDAYSMSSKNIEKLQNTLRILSGQYGILKPLDLIQAYRLEMGTKFPIENVNNLHNYWKPKVTDYLNNELKKGELFVNLASNEYFNAINIKELKTEVITPIFKDWKNDKLKVISFFAKKARGLMLRYIIETNAKTIDDLKGFNYERYSFSATESNQAKKELVFTR